MTMTDRATPKCSVYVYISEAEAVNNLFIVRSESNTVTVAKKLISCY